MPLVLAAAVGGFVSQILAPSMQLHAQQPQVVSNEQFDVLVLPNTTEAGMRTALNDKAKEGWKVRTSTMTETGYFYVVLAK